MSMVFLMKSVSKSTIRIDILGIHRIYRKTGSIIIVITFAMNDMN